VEVILSVSCVNVGLVSLYILTYVDAVMTLWGRRTRGLRKERLEVA